MPGKFLVPLLLLPSARASIPLVQEVGPAWDLGIAGNWARPHAAVDATGASTWLLTWAAEGDLWAGQLQQEGDAWQVAADSVRRLTDDGRLVDHAVEQCPDGTWLHVASLNLDQPDDSAWAFVYGADLELLSAGPVEERNPTRAHNDMALVCGERFRGVTFPDFDAGLTFYIPLGEDGSPADAVVLEGAPIMTGGSLVEDPYTGWLTAYGAEELVRLGVAQYDEDLAWLRYNPVEVTAGTHAWWPQGLVAVGEGWLTTYLSVPEDDAGRTDDLADIWLATLQDQLYMRQGHPVQRWEPPDGAGRPGLAYRDGLALVSYDHDNELYLHAVSVDPTGDPGNAGEDGGSADGGSADGGSADGGSADGGSADGGSADGSSVDGGSVDGGSEDGAPSGEPPGRGCSFVSSAGGLVLLWPALFALVRRSRC